MYLCISTYLLPLLGWACVLVWVQAYCSTLLFEEAERILFIPHILSVCTPPVVDKWSEERQEIHGFH